MAQRPFSVHAHGLFYNKAAEGSLYADHSSDVQQRDDEVEPNNVYIYNWVVNKQHAPTETDEDCVTRMYHSHVISVKDTNTGLIGIEERSFYKRLTKSVYSAQSFVSHFVVGNMPSVFKSGTCKVKNNYSKIPRCS